MSTSWEAKIAALMTTFSDLASRMDRVEERDRQLEEKIATATQKLETKIAARRAALRGNAPSFIPTSLSHKSPTPKEKPVQGEAKVRRETQAYWGTPAHHGAQARRGPQVRQEVQPAMHKQGPNQKPAARQPFRERKTMFYDKNVSAPSSAERRHVAFIQTLHRDGYSKDEIVSRTMAAFPELHEGRGNGSEEARRILVHNSVEVNTSMWADKVI